MRTVALPTSWMASVWTDGPKVINQFILPSLIILAVLWLAPHGFDWTDEGAYLLAISSPEQHALIPTRFAAVLYPFYSFLHGDIVALRRINVIVTLLLCWALCGLVARRALAFSNQDTALPHALILSLGLSTSGLLLWHQWVLTPSYTSLAFQACVIFGIGGLLLEGRQRLGRILGALVLGLSLALAFLAKPTTALGLAVISLGYSCMAPRPHSTTVFLVMSTCAATLLISALAFDGGPFAFATNLGAGAELTTVLRNGVGLAGVFRLDGLWLGGKSGLLFIAGGLCSALSSRMLVQREVRPVLRLLVIAPVLLPAMAVLVLALVLPSKVCLEPVFVLAICSGYAAGRISLRRTVLTSELARTAFILATLPACVALGTDENYWQAASKAGLFWWLALILLVKSDSVAAGIRDLRQISAWSLFLTILVLYQSSIHPYRQNQALLEAVITSEVGPHGTELRLAGGAAVYAAQLQSIRIANEFANGTPLLDFSGESPGATFAMGAVGVSVPWLLGGYARSEAFVLAALDRASCSELSRAWLLLEPTGSRPINSEILARYGMDIARDFTVVRTLTPPSLAGQPIRNQLLLRPVDQAGVLVRCGVQANSRQPANRSIIPALL